MSSLLLTLMVLTAAPTVTKESAVLVTATAMEALQLPAELSVEVDEWQREVRLSGPPKALARWTPKSHLCPKVERRGDVVVLRCTSARLDAHVRRGKQGAAVLELRALRGVPWKSAPVLSTPFKPTSFGLGGECPGTTPEGRAECALISGDVVGARAVLDELAKTSNPNAPTPPYVALRRGDLALMVDDDPVAALAQYTAVNGRGYFGRVARVRACELTGCEGMSLAELYDDAALPEPIRTMLELSELRARALRGAVGVAAGQLLLRLDEHDRPPPCETWSAVCLGVTSLALRDEDPEVQGLGLGIFTHLHRDGLYRREVGLTRQAADVAASLGAARYAANLLASITDVVPPTSLAEHLAVAASLYDRVGDKVRGDVLRDYAHTRVKRLPLVKGDASEELPSSEAAVAAMHRLIADTEQDVTLADALSITTRARHVSAPRP